METCKLLDGLYGIALGMDRDNPQMAAHLRTVALELLETRRLLLISQDLLAESLANTAALLNDELPESAKPH